LSWLAFETSVPGKWVLTGEHAVLRGSTAVALPHPEYLLKLSFKPSDQPSARPSNRPAFQVIPSSLEPVVVSILQSLNVEQPVGTLEISGNIPMGAGMGSSAALCVALTRWLAPKLSLSPFRERDFATELEHHFHGKSSGMDVATVMSTSPIAFSMKKGPVALNVSRLPRFTFHDTGLRASTRECVLKVQLFVDAKPTLAARFDDQMSRASVSVVEALGAYDRAVAESLQPPFSMKELAATQIARAMNDAHQCFVEWGLVPEQAMKLRDELIAQGALGAKLTGAGGGGFVVAIWG
jgi:mevalonate kinase